MENPGMKWPDKELKPVPKCCMMGIRVPAIFRARVELRKEVLCREVRYDQTEPG